MSYDTHAPILMAAVATSTGPILELGAGDSSTIALHYAAGMSGRLLVTADTDLAWLRRYQEYYCPRKHLGEHIEPVGDDALPLVTRLIEGWRRWNMIEALTWGCALVDCAPGEARHELAIRLAQRCKWVICHDSERDYDVGTNYMYDRLTPYFRHIREFRRLRPYTLIASNVAPFEIETCDRVWKKS